MTEVPAEVVDELKRSTPWIAMMAVVFFLVGIVSLGTFVIVLIGPHQAPTGQLRSLVYVPMVVLYLFLGLVLVRYLRSIALVRHTQTQDDLNRALRQHTQVWRAVGIAVIALVVLGVIFGGVF